MNAAHHLQYGGISGRSSHPGQAALHRLDRRTSSLVPKVGRHVVDEPVCQSLDLLNDLRVW